MPAGAKRTWSRSIRNIATRRTRAIYGGRRFLTNGEIDDVVEYVLKISGQQADEAKAARGDELFHDGTRGNCNDCHENDGVGNLALGLDEPDARPSSISTARIGRRSSNRSCAAAAARCPRSKAS